MSIRLAALEADFDEFVEHYALAREYLTRILRKRCKLHSAIGQLARPLRILSPNLALSLLRGWRLSTPLGSLHAAIIQLGVREMDRLPRNIRRGRWLPRWL